MRTWLGIARYHLIQPVIYLGMPWAILAISFLVNLIIFGTAAPVGPYHYTGGVATIYIFFVVTGVFGTGRSLPFGLALGVSRRSYYLGTALLAVILAAADGLALTVLQLIERATGGWGETLHFFRVPYILAGPWYLTWLTSTVVLALLFAYGMWLGIVYRRWSLPGSVAFAAAQIILAVGAVLVITWAHGWAGIGRFFTTLSAAGLTGLLAVLAAVLLTGGYATIRHATV